MIEQTHNTIIPFAAEAVLTNHDIREGMAQGYVVIDPFREDRLQTSSYDVSLGEYYWQARRLTVGSKLFNPHNPDHVRDVWGDEYYRAKTIREYRQTEEYRRFSNSDWNGLKLDDPIIVLGPGETILAHTEEFIGGRTQVTTMMKARSSWGRVFVSVCKDAGWGDVGYINRWTMEIQNNLKDHHTVIPVGQPIAQIVFFRTRPINSDQYEGAGTYQVGDNIQQLKEEWSPDSMLPRLKRKSSIYDI